MKLISGIIFSVFILISSIYAQSDVYFVRGTTKKIEMSEKIISVKLKKDLMQSDIDNLIKQEAGIEKLERIIASKDFYRLYVKNNESIASIINRLKSNEFIEFINPVYIIDGIESVPTDEFLVQFKSNISSSDIQILNDEYGIKIVRISSANEYLYTFQLLKKSDKSILEIANVYYNSLPCEWALPDLFIPCELFYSPNDSYFQYQYYLHNVGQTGGTNDADIDATEAWDITKGSSLIKIAVIDEGGSSNEDIPSSRILPGYDYVTNDSDPSPGGNQAHGMACAGIIGATQDNSIGTSGIAPNSKIMFVRIFNEMGEQTTVANIAAAIDFAWQNGADVISNSWGSSSNVMITDAINRALTQGRSGKGCVVVCASGNDGSIVAYPANLAGVIAVGSIDKSNSHWYYSNSGPELSVVAPSGDIAYGGTSQCDNPKHIQDIVYMQGDVWTTDIGNSAGYNPGTDGECQVPYYIQYRWQASPNPNNNYTANFGGTSAACPQVAGIAALILSINPDLTSQQVKYIINQSADDLGSIGFDNYYGFGRANAYQALLLALAYSSKSVNQTGTAYNNARKLVKESTSNYHLGFSSGGEIFYRKTTDAGNNWLTPIRLSTGNGNNNYPSISESSGRVYITWQRNTSSNNYDIYFAASTNGGTSWGTKYVLNSVTTTTDPLPSIQAASTYEMIVFRNGSGIKSFCSYYTFPTDLSYWVQRTTGFSTSYSPTVTSAYQNPSYYFPMALANSSDNHIYYYYFDPSTQNWGGGPNNLSSIVPGSGSHLTPSITTVPSSAQVHVAWKKLIGSGSSIYDHLVIHRKSTNYNTWPNEWFGTYYNSQENPSISALATNKVDLLYHTPSQFGTQTVYKMRFNGTYWDAPTLVASNARYPSVSSGNTIARYVWTSGSTSPYTVNYSSIPLTKESEVDAKSFYSRSIAWLDSIGSYLEIRLHPIYLKLKNGTKKRIDTEPADLEVYNLTLSNSWDLLSSVPFDISSDAEELVFDYSISGFGVKNLFNESLSDVNPIFGLSNEKGEVVASKTQNYIVDTDKIQEVRKQLSLNLLGLSNQKNTKAIIKLDRLKPREGVFASLGHIEDYTSLADKYEKQSEIVQEVAKVNGYDLSSYPNPFNPTTIISYSIPEKGYVKVSVFDILGREVTELVNEDKESGTYTITFDGHNLSSGVYICTITVNDYKASTKLIMAK